MKKAKSLTLFTISLLAAAGAPAQTANRGVTQTSRVRAVRATAQQSASCSGLGDFYWEIGNADRPLASGQVGTRFGSNTAINVASASKWIFGAYVLERLGRPPSASEVRALTMRSGYVSFRPLACALTTTVQGCFTSGGNSTLTEEDAGHFFYGGGHDQKLAVDLGLGGLTRAGLANEMRRLLGNDLELAYATPDLAGGASATPSAYGLFLRRILRGTLRIADYLSSPATCTLPASCPSALHSPVPVAWHYGLNHWIEDDPDGDGAFSSPGAFGFYPWVTAERDYYGILARHAYDPGASYDSAVCGQHLRRAWATGKAQLD